MRTLHAFTSESTVEIIYPTRKVSNASFIRLRPSL